MSEFGNMLIFGKSLASQSLPRKLITRELILKRPKYKKLTLIPLKEMKKRLKLWDIVQDLILQSMHLGELIKTEIKKKNKKCKKKMCKKNTKVEKKESLQEKPEKKKSPEHVESMPTAQAGCSTSKSSKTDQPKTCEIDEPISAIEDVLGRRVNKILDFLLRWKEVEEEDESEKNSWELVGGRADPALVLKILKRRLKRQLETLDSYK